VSEDNIQDLLRQGAEAAREKDRAKARELFQQVVDLDENNEKGWFFLSKVVDSDEEKRICLANVLHINPNNDAAQKAMTELESRERKRVADEEVMPGITRRQLTLAVGGGVILIVVVIAIFLAITTTRNAEFARQTQVVVEWTSTSASITEQAGATYAAATMTQQALATNTPTITPTRDVPATWTPVPEATLPSTAEALPCPQGLNGNIVAWSGRDIQSNDFLPIRIFSLGNCGQSTIVGDANGNDIGRNPTFDPVGQRVIYTAYLPTTFDFGIQLVNANGTQREDLSERWRSFGEGIFKPEMPTFTADGSKIAFVGQAQDTLKNEVFLLDLNGPPDVNPITRLTSDNAIYTFPAISPDGTRIAVIRNDVNSATPGPDIVVIDVATRSQIAVTSDFATFTESAPRWTPDGLQLVFAAADANNPLNNDIFLRNADGSGGALPILEVRTEFDEIFPIFSPDGNYVAFSSNRSGFYDLYVFDRINLTVSQLTNTEDEDYPGGWY
jgi:hypothetical protein